MASSSSAPSLSSSSSSSATVVYPGRPYDVFLSFRGPDARNGFGDYLYQALTDADIKTFRDFEEIRAGYALRTEILKAVEQSKIAIPIFSKRYAESKWCLRELAKILECHRERSQIVIPVFYRVEQSKVKGNYQDCIDNYELYGDDITNQDREKWKADVAKIPANKTTEFELKEGDLMYEREVLDKVVAKILSILPKKKAREAPIKVGINRHVEKLQAWVEDTKSIDVRLITIVGMSGIGKTTIARAIYNHLGNCFDSRICFLEDVAETSKRENGITELQSVLLSKITNSARKNFADEHQGSNQIKKFMSRKNVFVVLDNVNSISQINMLLMGGKDALQMDCKSGSLFIITTTNESILPAITTTENTLPTTSTKTDENTTSTKTDENTTSTKTDEKTTKTSRVYMYDVERMESGEALELFCQHAFQTKYPPIKFEDLTKDVVSTAGGLPLALVILGSYVSNEKDKNSREAMLKKLISVPSMEVLNRLRIGYDALDVEQKQIFLDIACFFAGKRKEYPIKMWEACGFHPDEGIRALKSRSLITIEDDNIIKMHDQLIQLGKQIVKEKVGEPYLKVLRKRSRICDQHEAMVTFRNHDQAAEMVEVLNLNLEKIQVSQLAKHEQLGSFRTFVERDVTRNQNLYINDLGEKDFTHLPNLRFLRLGYASLEGDFRYLFSNLRWLEWSCRLKEKATLIHGPKPIQIAVPKPVQIARLKLVPKPVQEAGPEHLRIPWRKPVPKPVQIAEVPKAVPLKINLKINLKNLVILDLSDSNITDEWLKCIMPLKVANKLKVLNLSKCRSLTKVPDGFTALETLDVSHWSIKNLDCSALTNLVNLKSSKCRSLTSINLSNCTKLKTLDTYGCKKLTEIQNLKNIESLEVLNMNSCKRIQISPDFSNSRNLKKLSMTSCFILERIKGLEGLVSIVHMNLLYCVSLTELPVLSNSTMLTTLNLEACFRLSSINGFGDLKFLEVLNLKDCWNLSTLPSLSTAIMLKELILIDCAMLPRVDGFECLESLEHLDMSRCKLIERLVRLPDPKKLKILNLTGCEISEIEGFSEFVSLEILHISRCNKLTKTLNLSTLKSLKSLYARRLKWTRITGLDEVKFLEGLHTKNCKLLEELPDFSNFPKLKILDVTNCRKLTTINGYDDLVKRQCKIDLKGSGCKIDLKGSGCDPLIRTDRWAAAKSQPLLTDAWAAAMESAAAKAIQLR